MKYLFLLPALVVGLGLITATTDFLHAEIFTVTTTNASSSGSLPVRIAQANVTPGKNEIKITVTNVITLGSPLPTISNSLTIIGAANTPAVISGGGVLQIFNFAAGTTNSLSNLVLANGYTTNNGAAISNASILSISGCVITNNNAINGFGGAIFNSGAIAISSSVISGNRATRFGGGIYNTGALSISCSIFLTNCATAESAKMQILWLLVVAVGVVALAARYLVLQAQLELQIPHFFQNASIGGNGGGITSASSVGSLIWGGNGGGAAGGSGGGYYVDMEETEDLAVAVAAVLVLVTITAIPGVAAVAQAQVIWAILEDWVVSRQLGEGLAYKETTPVIMVELAAVLLDLGVLFLCRAEVVR